MDQVDARGARGVQVGDGNVQINLFADRRPARSAYLHQVRAIAPEILVGREAELAELAAFCTDPDGGDYRWLRAAPWAGKTALLSWFVLHPPPGVRIVSFFITARLAAQSDRDAFLDVVIEQLATMLDEPVPAFLTDATRAAQLLALLDTAATACAADGQRLILVVDGLDEDTGGHSVAALLPASPPAGSRVLVAGRHDPPLPADVPTGHPLRAPGVEHTIAASPHARDIQREAERELKRLLRGSPAEQDLLGLVTAAGGGLSGGELAELTGRQAWEVEDDLHAVAGRTFTSRPAEAGATVPEVYLLGHEELHAGAVRFIGDTRLAGYRRRLHDWADGYRRDRWPASTPGYLLHGYFPLLQVVGDLPRMITHALDPFRHDRMLDVHGGDTTALAEIAAAQDALLDRDPADLRSMALLAVRRDGLVERNRHIPVDLPAVWARLGRSVRGLALARSIADPTTRVTAMIALGGTLGEPAAAEVRQEAEAVARGITLRHERESALAAVAKARSPGGFAELRDKARAGDLAGAVAIADAQERRRAEALRVVVEAGALAGDIVGAAAVAGTIADPTQHAWALAALAAHAGDPDRATEFAAEAVAVARGATDQYVRARALVPATKATLAAGELDRATDLAREVIGPDDRARMLAQVAESRAAAGELGLAATLVSEAASTVASVSGADQQANVLAAVVRAAARTGDTDHVRRLVARAWGLLGTVADNPEWQRVLMAQLMAAGETVFRLARPLLRATGEQDLVVEEAARIAVLAGDLDHAVTLAGAIVDQKPRARAITSVAQALALAGQHDRATDLAAEAEAAARSSTLAQHWAVALADVASAVARAGDLDRARVLADSAATLATSIVDPHWRAQASARAAVAMALAGSHDRATALARGAERLARTFGEQRLREWVLPVAAEAAAVAGDFDHALAVVKSITNRLMRGPAQRTVIAAMAGGRRQVLDLVQAITDPYDQLLTSAEAARAAAAAGHADTTLTQAAEALALAATVASWRSTALTVLARAAALAGQYDQARRLTLAAAEAADTITDRRQRAKSLAEIAQCAAIANDRDHARSLATEAETELRAAESPWELVKIVEARALIGDHEHAETLAGSLGTRLQAQALAFLAQHVDTARARPLIARALRLADWRDSVDALTAVDPAVLTDIAATFLTEVTRQPSVVLT
ncbi:P-loop domain-containing protein [Actinophytocola sediminis]